MTVSKQQWYDRVNALGSVKGKGKHYADFLQSKGLMAPLQGSLSNKQLALGARRGIALRWRSARAPSTSR